MNLSRQAALFKQAMQTDGNSGFHFLLKLLMMIISFVMLMLAGLTGSGSKGLYMLSLVSTVNLFFVTIATVSLFCTSVTEEKEHNTLGILLMTGISPFGLLSGKLISKLYIVLQLILLQIPLIVIARTMGGLSMDQILAHLVYFLAMILIMSQVGMFFSIISQKSSKSIFFTSVFLLFLFILPCNNSATFLTYYFKIFATGFNAGIISQPVIILLVLSLIIFLSALMLFNKFTYDESSSVLSSEVSVRKIVKRERFGTNPIFEKDFRYLSGYRAALAVRVICAFVFISFSKSYTVGDALYGLVVAWFYCECFYYSQVMVKTEKNAKTLSSLGVLPMSPKNILNQKYKAFAVSVAPSLLTCFYFCLTFSRGILPGLLSFAVLSLACYAHFLIALICSLRYEKMSMLISVLYILLFSLLCGACPIGWLLFLPSLVILSVNVYEGFALEISKE